MALAQIKEVVGRGVYIPGDDIDTDQIVPARYLVSVTFDGLGEALFYDARFERDGKPKQHPLNDATYKGATIVLGNANFGCGSSREHAPQAFAKAGFKAIIAESFAEIFFGNSTTLGIPCVTLNHDEIEGLARAIAAKPSLEITVDVEHLEIRAEAQVFKCQLKPSAHDALVRGEWDPIAQLIEGEPQARALSKTLPYTSW
ncbi:MAG TPA: 3-isopropylmalate dehydratase small subunit [Polyangiales bacterium]|nr:3-isopropylmalate dehydratase small subunit [Polyangiales bacterium]